MDEKNLNQQETPEKENKKPVDQSTHSQEEEEKTDPRGDETKTQSSKASTSANEENHGVKQEAFNQNKLEPDTSKGEKEMDSSEEQPEKEETTENTAITPEEEKPSTDIKEAPKDEPSTTTEEALEKPTAKEIDDFNQAGEKPSDTEKEEVEKSELDQKEKEDGSKASEEKVVTKETGTEKIAEVSSTERTGLEDKKDEETPLIKETKEEKDRKESEKDNQEKKEEKKEEENGDPDNNDGDDAEEDNGDKNTDESGKDSGNEELQFSKIDYSGYSKEALLQALQDLIKNYPVDKIRQPVETLKLLFYRKHRADTEEIREKFLEEGGNIQDFKAPDDVSEQNFKELLKRYREERIEQNRRMESSKQENLEKKYAVIEKIKDLVNSNESLNKTFQEFKEYQKEWFSIGVVPQQNLKDLWDNYNHVVEMFYDYIKINKELRDLDFKKNLDEKIALCEKAEELIVEPSVVKAFKTLQKHHQLWREIGPVPRENREEIWERFKEATSKINKRHHEHFQNLKQSQQENLENKTKLCEKAEEISTEIIDNPKKWEQKSHDLINLQNEWKTIGFAPKKDNSAIYQRFRNACDTFFKNKRDFFAQHKEVLNENLQVKTEFCMQAEAVQDSEDWKKTTDELIALQKKWKQVGPVPRKHSDKIWKRFRAACDHFFNRKGEHFSTQDERYEDNLKKKFDLIEKIEKFKLESNVKENFNQLNAFQREWAGIGFVPLKNKDEVQQKYREAINKHFDNLNIEDSTKKVLKYKNKIASVSSSRNSPNRMRQDRDKFINKIKQLENDITLWENNKGFFAKSKNAESMIKDVEKKIENAKKEIKVIEEKIRVIDDLDND